MDPTGATGAPPKLRGRYGKAPLSVPAGGSTGKKAGFPDPRAAVAGVALGARGPLLA